MAHKKINLNKIKNLQEIEKNYFLNLKFCYFKRESLEGNGMEYTLSIPDHYSSVKIEIHTWNQNLDQIEEK